MKAACKPPADDLLSQLAQKHDICFAALGARSSLVQYQMKMTANVTGLTNRAFIPSLLAAADVLLGPIMTMAVTETNRAGVATNVATNVSAAFLANVAPTGCVKTFSMNLGPRGIGIAASACRLSDYAEIRHLVKHIPTTKDGMSPAVLGDGSAAFKYKTLEGNPKLCVFGEFIDESDGHVNRLEGSGLLDVRTELDQFNSGYRLSKNDGVTSGNREHFKISRAINLQPAQMVRLCALDLGSA